MASAPLEVPSHTQPFPFQPKDHQESPNLGLAALASRKPLCKICGSPPVPNHPAGLVVTGRGGGTATSPCHGGRELIPRPQQGQSACLESGREIKVGTKKGTSAGCFPAGFLLCMFCSLFSLTFIIFISSCICLINALLSPLPEFFVPPVGHRAGSGLGDGASFWEECTGRGWV